MLRKPSNKIRKDFLESAFPENPLPFRKLNRKGFLSLKEKNRKGLRNRIKRVEDRIIKRESGYNALEKNNLFSVVTPNKIKKRESFINGKPQHKNTKTFLLGLNHSLERKGKLFVTRKYIFSLEQLSASFYKKQKKYRKLSVFKNLLEERKKLSIVYGGLGEKQIQKLLLQAKKLHGKFDENLIKILERRLDVALFRICFFPTIFSAKQWISHKHVYVNNSLVTLPGYQLRAGDIITIAPEKKNVLKRKICNFIAEKIRIRSFHFSYPLHTLYNLTRNVQKSSLSNLRDYKNTLGFFKLSNNNKILNLKRVFNKLFIKKSIWSFLQLRNLFTTARPLTQRVKGLRISSMKPLNLEVCYKNMVAVFLYSPQKVAVPASLNLRAILKKFQ